MWIGVLGGTLFLFSCDREDGPVSPSREPVDTEARLGPISRHAIVRAEPRFAPDQTEQVDSEAVAGLRTVAPGATVTVVLGLWCDDSQRELSRWFRALDQLGSPPPFRIDYIAVGFHEIAQRIAPLEIEYVPTFIVSREGAEVGRMVETSPNGIERDVLRLLSGEVRGVVGAPL